MISIVICSRNKEIPVQLKQNINDSIGCEYQLIVINNSANKYSIFKAYNKGLKKSRFSIVCFIHEDILFHTQDWGKILYDILIEKDLSLLGVAGSRVKSEIPSGWWEQPKDSLVMNIIQHRPDGRKEHVQRGFTGKKTLQPVSVLDGVFLAFKKDSKVKFNEELYGFHNYDLSFCIDVLKGSGKIGVTNEILIEHFSNGRIDNTWINSSHHFHKKYKHSLPVQVKDNSLSLDDKIEQLEKFIVHCKNAGNVKLALNYWLKLIQKRPFSSNNFMYLTYFVGFARKKIQNKWN